MTSEDTVQLNYAADWLKRIQKRSRLISGSESNCIQFFGTLEEKIEQTKKHLTSSLNK